MISSGAAARPTVYVFVDAGHLRPNFQATTTAWFGAPAELDVGSLRAFFNATKLFYYDSIDDVLRKDESQEDLERRIQQQESALREINSFPNTHVRFGSITGSGKKKRQKEVDILIAVDMMNHAIRQNMDRAVLVTGDRDFTPLVETLVQLGLTVDVAGDFRYTADVLQAAADSYRPLNLSAYAQLVSDRARQNFRRVLSFSGGATPVPANAEPFLTGVVGKEVGKLYIRAPQGFYLEISNRYGSRYLEFVSLDEFKAVQLFLKLELGEAPWLEPLEDHLRRASA